jgi:hypothetical protein
LRKTFITVDVDSDEVGAPMVLSMREFIEDEADGSAIDIDMPASSEDVNDKEEVERGGRRST